MYVPNFDQNPTQKVGRPADASQQMRPVAERVYQKCKIMILVVDGVSLTTVASIMDPFMHANKILGRDRFDLERVSLLEQDPLTPVGIRLACEKTSNCVLAHGDVKNRPDFVMLACGQEVDKTSQKAL